MQSLREKKERRIGEKLFLKQERCTGPKCASVRRAYPPGVHGTQRRRRREASEYGMLMREKQKVRYLYGLDDRELKRYSEKAALGKERFASHFFQLLEERLDNTVFRLGIAPSRRTARQLVSHGHITVNGRTCSIPSYRVRIADAIGIKESARAIPWRMAPSQHLPHDRKHVNWLSQDEGGRSGKVLARPVQEELDMQLDFAKVREFYAR